MNSNVIVLISLRSLALLATLQGQLAYANTLNMIAEAVESGKNIDDHLAVVAEALKNGNAIQWAEVTARIRELQDQLHAEPTEEELKAARDALDKLSD